MRLPTILFLATTLMGSAVQAAPRVVADIAPVHSLAAQVMAGLGEPHLLLPPGVSPHGYALRPSEAETLDRADIVIWIGEDLTPWLHRPIEALAEGAMLVTLMEVKDAISHGTDDDDEHGHEDEHGQDDRHGHEHGEDDPHIWLDPENARAMLGRIAEALSKADPVNAETYRANAARAQAEIDMLIKEVEAIVAPLRGRPYVVFHDAYRGFEGRFGVAPIGSLSLGDADRPGPRRIAEIRARLHKTSTACVFTEPQFPSRAVDVLLEGTGARRGTLDPLGADHTPGPDHYAATIRGIALGLRDCLE